MVGVVERWEMERNGDGGIRWEGSKEGRKERKRGWVISGLGEREGMNEEEEKREMKNLIHQ